MGMNNLEVWHDYCDHMLREMTWDRTWNAGCASSASLEACAVCARHLLTCAGMCA